MRHQVSLTSSACLCVPFSQVTCHVAVSLMTIKSSRAQETPHGESHRSTHTCAAYASFSCFPITNPVLFFCCCCRCFFCPVHCGISRRVSRPQFSRATPVMSWVCPFRPTSTPSCREPATLQSNCGTSGTACAGRPSRATNRTSTLSVWVSSGTGCPCRPNCFYSS